MKYLLLRLYQVLGDQPIERRYMERARSNIGLFSCKSYNRICLNFFRQSILDSPYIARS